MLRYLTVLAAVLSLPLLGAAEGRAADLGNRLVAGGASAGLADPFHLAPSQSGESRSALLGGAGGFSLGSLSGGSAQSRLALPFGGAGGLAAGGYMAYGLGDAFLSSSLRSDGRSTRAEISASYVGGLLGSGSAAALSLGTAWSRAPGISPNPLQPGLALAEPGAGAGDVNLSLSVMHQMTPSFAFGGVAQASRPQGDDRLQGADLMLGAGLGLKF